jgi:NAD(P)-dependent dehydrogenase (short-subunit alcohol dehydrogenase family)
VGGFDQQVAWVTGGSSGIGAAVVDVLRSGGAAVAVMDLRRSEQTAGVRYFDCDISSADAVEAAASAIEAEVGPPDILVTCAGVSGSAPIGELADELWSRVIAVNLTGTFNVVRRVFPTMTRRRRGQIVLISSDSAVRVLPGQAAYSASKAGVVALGKVVAVEGASYGIRCNTIAPGIVDTPMSRQRWPSREDLDAAATTSAVANLMGAVLDPVDIADAVAFLCGTASRHITGQLLHVNGGAQLG